MLSDGQILASRYEIIRKLKSGGMGTVYEAFDTTLNARVAIKESLFTDENLRRAFRREAQLLANLSHPSLPRSSDLFSTEAGQYFVMEYIEGDDLAMLLAKSNSLLPVETVLGWAKQLLDLLEYLHRRATQHRDIKPGNIKVREGHVYLLDFGLAYGRSGDMTTLVGHDFNWACHSPNYSSPEQLRCEHTTPASDLYSFAATLYALLTGGPPHEPKQRKQMKSAGEADPLKDLRSCRSEVDKDVSRAVMRALALSPNQRPKSAAEMRRLMFPSDVKRSNRSVSRKLVTVGSLAAVIPLGLMAGIWFPDLNANLCRYSSSSVYRQVFRCDALKVESQQSLTSAEQVAQLLAEGEELLQRSDPEPALKKIEAALALDPSNAYAHFLYGDALWDIRSKTLESVTQMPEVREQADIVLKLVPLPRTPQEHIARGWANLAKGKVDIAITETTAALQSIPDSVSALMIRASAKANNAEVDNERAFESFADYKRVIQLMPKYAKAYANRGATYYALGQNNLALSDFQEAVRLAPRAGFHYKLGFVNFSLNRFDEASNNFQQALRVSPECYSAYLGLGDIYFQAEDWRKSTDNYDRANQINPTHYAYSRLGNAYLNLNEFRRSVESYRQALLLDPNDYRSQSGMGVSFAHLKDFNKAVDSFTAALTHAPKNDRSFLAFVYKCRADALRQLGEDERAESDEQMALNR